MNGLIVALALPGLAFVATSESLQMTPADMRIVPGATFQMGTDPNEVPGIMERTGLIDASPLEPEMPARSITVATFFLDTFDVSNADFADFLADHPQWRKDLADPSHHNGRYLEHWTAKGPPEEVLDHPVTFVTWFVAVAYCQSLGKRLPTEAEYEWAAQNPSTRAEYPWGDAPPTDNIVSWGGNGIDTTVPVGSYPPNDRGLYDMAGNVWHFVSDPWLGSYQEMLGDSTSGEAHDPMIRRVVRGGSWGANAVNLRVRYRDSHRPFDAREMVGFRCAMSAVQ
ncbi:MAG: formylglycine-generating enzyme family protein [Gammaproteobacteria bacterium]